VTALALLIATFSRGGILTTVAAAGLTLVLAGRAEMGAAWRWFASGLSLRRALALRLALAAVVVAAFGGAAVLLSQKGYIARLWNTRASDVTDFLIQNSAGARGAYTASDEDLRRAPVDRRGFGCQRLCARLPEWALQRFQKSPVN
jgi:hypothetical protein